MGRYDTNKVYGMTNVGHEDFLIQNIKVQGVADVSAVCCESLCECCFNDESQ